jgi:hypothetical protein
MAHACRRSAQQQRLWYVQIERLEKRGQLPASPTTARAAETALSHAK